MLGRGFLFNSASHSQHQDSTLPGLDCKMRPWMRDLPTSVWAGQGWAFHENGPRELPSTGGSNAMQGAEVFESAGVAAEEVKTTDQEIKETPAIVAATAPAPPLVEGQKPYRFTRSNLAKQSGVQNIIWNNGTQSWSVQFKEDDRKTSRNFAVKKFVGPGCSEEEADAMALQAALTFRAELVQQGILSEPKVKDPNFTSEVPGVVWCKKRQDWVVQIALDKKRIQGGYFTEKAAAEAKALELREQHGLQRQVKPVDSLATLPAFHPKVPCPGVLWEINKHILEPAASSPKGDDAKRGHEDGSKLLSIYYHLLIHFPCKFACFTTVIIRNILGGCDWASSRTWSERSGASQAPLPMWPPTPCWIMGFDEAGLLE